MEKKVLLFVTLGFFLSALHFIIHPVGSAWKYMAGMGLLMVLMVVWILYRLLPTDASPAEDTVEKHVLPIWRKQCKEVIDTPQDDLPSGPSAPPTNSL